MMKTLTLTAVIALTTAPAFAQELTFGSGSLDRGTFDTDGDSATALSIEGDVEFTYNQFVFGASAKVQANDQGFGDESISNYGAFAGYMPTADVLVGAGLTGIAIEGGETYNGYEVFGQYDNGQYGVAIVHEKPTTDNDDFSVTTVYGRAALSPDVTLAGAVETISDEDENVYYLSADYAAGPIAARAYYHGITGVDVAIYGASGRYDFGQGWFGSADLQQAEGYFGNDITLYAIGGGYRISDSTLIDASFGQATSSGDEANVLRLGLTFETGNRKRLDGALSDAFRGDLSKGIGMLAPDLGIGGGINLY